MFHNETFQLRGHPLSTYAKFSGKTNISNPLILSRMCTYQGDRNVSFSGNFAYAINGWSVIGSILVLCLKKEQTHYFVVSLHQQCELFDIFFQMREVSDQSHSDVLRKRTNICDDTFCKKSLRLLVVNHLRKKFYHIYLRRFKICNYSIIPHSIMTRNFSKFTFVN